MSTLIEEHTLSSQPKKAKRFFSFKSKKNEVFTTTESPFLILMGSISQCSKKDAEAYVKGLAETYSTSLETSWYRIIEDKKHNRFVYEIQEGGVGVSVLEKVLAELEHDSVYIDLANDGYATISEENEQIYTLVATDGDMVHSTQIGVDRPITKHFSHYFSDKKMKELYPSRREYKILGMGLLLFSMLSFAATGTAYVFTASGLFNDDLLMLPKQKQIKSTLADNPSIQLERAKKATSNSGRHIQILEKKNGTWSWKLG